MSNIDRNVLIQHLADLRAVEVAKNQLIKQHLWNQNRIKTLGLPRIVAKQPMQAKDVVMLLIAWFIAPTLLSPLLILASNIPDELYFLALIVILIVLLLPGIISIIIVTKHAKQRKQTYQMQLEQDRLRVQSENYEKNQLIHTNSTVAQKIQEANAVLSDMYGANILPMQVRNLSGVCYLYDYLSTSQESLDSALMNYNMNRINTNVERVIEQQSNSILQQYEANARLERLEGHSRALSGQLSRIEQNTENTAAYSAITAANTKAIAFFEGYQFFRGN